MKLQFLLPKLKRYETPALHCDKLEKTLRLSVQCKLCHVPDMNSTQSKFFYTSFSSPFNFLYKHLATQMHWGVTNMFVKMVHFKSAPCNHATNTLAKNCSVQQRHFLSRHKHVRGTGFVSDAPLSIAPQTRSLKSALCNSNGNNIEFRPVESLVTDTLYTRERCSTYRWMFCALAVGAT